MKEEMKTIVFSGVLVLVSMMLFLVMSIDSPTGYFTIIDVAPQDFTFETPEDISQEAALLSLNSAKDEIIEVENLNLSTDFMKDVLNEAEESYDTNDYLNVFKTTQLISFLKKEKFEFLDKVVLIKRKEQDFSKENVDTSTGKELIEQAQEAFSKDQLDEANGLLRKAGSELDKAKKEKSRLRDIALLGKNFFLRYWWQIILAILVVSAVSYPTVKKILKERKKKKLAALKVELVKTKDLIKGLQESCFKKKKITTKTYKIKVAKFEERLTKIKSMIPVLEAQLTGKKVEKKKKRGIIEVKK